ncbi:MAG TPA: Ig-like domain-containing protein [Vicinamibacterales bacterium]|nr:Ig-like domain-containing protein [Vicinamibacterales bacterium]
MRIPLSAFGYRRALIAALIVLTVSGNSAQPGSFNSAFEGQLWGVRHELTTPSYPSGLTFVDRILYLADSGGNIVAYYEDGTEKPLPDADWTVAAMSNPASPLFGLIPNQLGKVPIAIVDGASRTETTAVLVSDVSVNRVMAFDPDGRYLFTLQLDWPGVSYRGDVVYADNSVAIINGMAMSPGSQFEFSPSQGTLQLVGSFAAAWAADYGRFPGALLAYHEQPFTYDAGEKFFEAAPHAVLTDNGTVIEPFGVTFDSQSNLYFVDTISEKVRGYSPNFSPLFTFGTPAPGGTTEFYQPFGLSFWPDENGGRLFIADAINNRVVAYRPNLSATPTLEFLFAIEGLTVDGLDNALPYALDLDPASGRLATTDSSGIGQRSWILQTRNLAVFDLKALDGGGGPVEAVCSGALYSVQFGLTVPEGQPAVGGILPVLEVDGSLIPPPTTAGIDLAELQTAIYTYSLVAPGDAENPFTGELMLLASGTAATTADVLSRRGSVVIRNCANDTPPTVAVTHSDEPPQASGWIPMYNGEPFTIHLTAVDDVEVKQIEYRLEGANDIGFKFPPVANPNPGSSSQTLPLTLTEPGLTTVWFRARDNDFTDSEWQQVDFWLMWLPDRQNAEGDSINFSVGGPIEGAQTYSTGPLPPGISFDPHTATFSGVLAFDSAGSHTVVVTETLGEIATNFQFAWTVANTNRPPVATPDTYGTNEDQVLLIAAPGVLGTDTDPDAGPLYALLHEPPAQGLLFLQSDGSFEYRLVPDFSGAVTFYYRANDFALDSEPVPVTIIVNAVNDPPSFTAGPNQIVSEDAGPQTIAAWATAISAGPANESDQAVTFVLSNDNPALFAAPPAVSPGGTLTYQPAPNRFGTATVIVRATDNGGTAHGGSDTSATQLFTITVLPVNDAPLAAADSYSVVEGQTLTVPAPGVLGNDADIDSALLLAAATSTPPGSLAFSADGSFVYTPPAGFTGPVTFTYSLSDGVASASATVTIVVAAANLPPVCSAATVSPSIVWPVNHKPVYVTVGGVVDPEGDVTITFNAISQDEPTDSEGQGNTLQDGGIEAGGTRAWVRAERAATKKVPGDGRVYLVAFTATDAGGLTCAGTLRIGVPHDQRGSRAVLSPGRWNSLTGQKLP